MRFDPHPPPPGHHPTVGLLSAAADAVTVIGETYQQPPMTRLRHARRSRSPFGRARPSGGVDAPPDGRVAQRVSVMLSSSANPEPPAKKGDPFASRITLKPAFRSTCRETEEPKAPHDPVDG